MANRFANSIKIDGLSDMNIFKDKKDREKFDDFNDKANSDFLKKICKNAVSGELLRDRGIFLFDTRGTPDYADIADMSKAVGNKEISMTSYDTDDYTPMVKTIWKDGENIEAYIREYDFETDGWSDKETPIEPIDESILNKYRRAGHKSVEGLIDNIKNDIDKENDGY